VKLIHKPAHIVESDAEKLATGTAPPATLNVISSIAIEGSVPVLSSLFV